MSSAAVSVNGAWSLANIVPLIVVYVLVGILRWPAMNG